MLKGVPCVCGVNEQKARCVLVYRTGQHAVCLIVPVAHTVLLSDHLNGATTIGARMRRICACAYMHACVSSSCAWLALGARTETDRPSPYMRSVHVCTSDICDSLI